MPLNPLEPIGIGTGEVEGLGGYIARLARSHRVSVDRLVRHAAPELARHSPSCAARKLKCHWQHAQPLLAKRFGALTGRPLLALTLDPWTPILAPHALWRTTMAWCPDCLGGDRIRYERLLWRLAPVRCCALHGRLLCHRCPTCDAPVARNQTTQMQWRCFRCGGALWLGTPAEMPADWDLRVHAMCSSLLIRRRAPMSRERIASMIGEMLQDAEFLSMRAAAETTGVPEATLWNLSNGSSCAPRLEVWCRLAAWRGIDLPDLLAGVPGPPPPEPSAPKPPHQMAAAHRTRTDRLREIERQIDTLRDQHPEGLSARATCRRLRASIATLERHFADELKDLAGLHHASRDKQQRLARRRLIREIVSSHKYLSDWNPLPSWYRVRKLLGMTHRSGSPLAREVMVQLQRRAITRLAASPTEGIEAPTTPGAEQQAQPRTKP